MLLLAANKSEAIISLEPPHRFQTRLKDEAHKNLKPHLYKAGEGGGKKKKGKGGTVMETSDSKWFTTIQPAQHGCPLS